MPTAGKHERKLGETPLITAPSPQSSATVLGFGETDLQTQPSLPGLAVPVTVAPWRSGPFLLERPAGSPVLARQPHFRISPPPFPHVAILPMLRQTSPDLTLPLAQPITLMRGPRSHLVTLMDAAILIRDMEALEMSPA